MAEPPPLQPRYAGFLPRFLALFIDGLLLLPLPFLFGRLALDQTGAIAAAAFLHFQAVLYNILLLGLGGQTLGMRAAGIRVFRQDLSPLRWTNALRRYLVDILLAVSGLFVEACLFAQAPPDYFHKSFFVLLLNLRNLDESYGTFQHWLLVAGWGWLLSELVVLLLNERKRAIHDFIGGTVVCLVDRKREVLTQAQPAPSFVAARVVFGLTVAVVSFEASSLGFFQFLLKTKLDKMLAPPPELQATGVRQGQGFLSQSAVVQDDKIGEAMDLIPDPRNPGVFLAAGKRGILSFKATGEVVGNHSFVDFGFSIRELRWVPLGSGLGLMNKGGWIGQVSVMDPEGKTLWSYDTPMGNDDMTAGNLEGDSNPRFILGMNGAGGVQALDNQGQLLWQIPEKNVWHVEAADLNGDGKDLIIHSNAGGKLLVRNDKGEVVKEFQPPVYPSHFFIVPWAGAEKWVAVIPDKTKFLFFSLQQGAPVTEFDTGIKIGSAKTRGKWVEWSQGSGKSLALLTDYSPVNASFLTVFDESGQIQYQEVFGEPCGALAVVDGPAAGTQELWCGCENRILRYQKGS